MLLDATTSRTKAPDASAARVRSAVSRGVRGWLIVGVVALLGVEIGLVGQPLLTAARAIEHATLGWLLVALVAAVSSMVAFGALRSRTLRMAGVRVPVGQAAAVSYAAGAMHVTMPAGAVFSTTYAFRHIRGWGGSSSAATWSLTVTGLLSSVTLSVIGVMGLGLSGPGTSSPLDEALELGGVGLLIAAVVAVTRKPELLLRLACRTLRAVNRLRRRPPETGVGGLSVLARDLRSIKPSVRDWGEGLGLAMLNWLLDVGALAACCAAMGLQVSLSVLLLTYTAGMAAASLSPLPAGVGAVETAMTLALTLAGTAGSAALAVVLLYRLISVGTIVAVGWTVVALQHKHHSPARDHQRIWSTN